MSYNSTVSVTIVKIFCRFENWMMSRHGPAGIPWILLPELRQDQIQTNSYCHSQHLCAVLLPLQLSAQIVERWKLLSLRADRTESQPTRPRPLPMATAMMILTVTEETICKGSMMEKTAGRKSGPGSSYLEPPRFSPADLRLPQRRLHAASLVYSCHAGLFTDRRLHQVRLQARDAAPAGPPRSGWACRAGGRLTWLGLLRAPLPVIRRRHAPPRPAGFAACRRDHGTSASPQPARRADSVSLAAAAAAPQARCWSSPSRRRTRTGTAAATRAGARPGGVLRRASPPPPPARPPRVASSCLRRGGGAAVAFLFSQDYSQGGLSQLPAPVSPARGASTCGGGGSGVFLSRSKSDRAAAAAAATTTKTQKQKHNNSSSSSSSNNNNNNTITKTQQQQHEQQQQQQQQQQTNKKRAAFAALTFGRQQGVQLQELAVPQALLRVLRRGARRGPDRRFFTPLQPRSASPPPPPSPSP